MVEKGNKIESSVRWVKGFLKALVLFCSKRPLFVISEELLIRIMGLEEVFILDG